MYIKKILEPITRKSLSREEFLKMGGAGIAGLALFGAAGPAFAVGETTMSADTLGISPENTAERNRENLVRALSHSSESIVFPPGDYLLDNSGPYVTVKEFSGVMTMQEGARLIFTDRSRRGLNFDDCRGASFRGLRTAFLQTPDRRMSDPSQECIVFHHAEDVSVEDADIDGSASGGLVFWRCVRPRVFGAVIRNTMADGLHFANCQDPEARDVLTENTGDDGLAFLNYADGPEHSGGKATNVTVRNSKSRGIVIGGHSNVVIDGFTVVGTSFSGLSCAQEQSWNTRVPSNVTFKNGEVTDAGTVVDPAGKNSVRHGIFYNRIGSIEFENVKVFSPAARGVSGEARPFSWQTFDGTVRSEPSGTVTLTDVEVQGAVETGFAFAGGLLYLDSLTARDSGGESIYVVEADLLNYGKLTSINASKTYASGLAFNIEHNVLVEGNELMVIDDQTVPTGYKVTTHGTQAGRLGVIVDRITNGDLAVENNSSLTIGAGPEQTPPS